jgi:outer membrane protein TolC
MNRIFLFLLLLMMTFAIFADVKKLPVLTIHDAILLAIRKNPNVLQAELNDVLQKYSLQMAEWEFKPHYTFAAKTTTMRNYSVTDDGFVTQNSTGVDGTVTILSPYGTKGTFASTVNQTSHFHPSLSLEIMQPLVRGFGRPIVEASLYNARDNKKISALNIENVLRNTVTSVINAYLDVIAAEKNLRVDEDALERAKLSASQTQFFIKAGRKAGVELVAVEADVARMQTNIENDKNNLQQVRFALLNAIGLDPNIPFEFATVDIHDLIKKYHIPTLITAKTLTIDNDIQYQTDQMTYYGAKQRSLLTAEDSARVELNLTGNLSAGSAADDGHNSGLSSLVNGINQSSSLTLNLVVPIDDQVAKMAVQSAKIALKDAQIALQHEKWNKETMTITGWNSIYSAERALKFADNAEKLQQKSYDISLQKYAHGLIDSLQLQSSQQQVISTGQALNMAEINYLKALVNFDLMIGQTLKTWDIKMKRGSGHGS